jgi:hypothetical protein
MKTTIAIVVLASLGATLHRLVPLRAVGAYFGVVALGFEALFMVGAALVAAMSERPEWVLLFLATALVSLAVATGLTISSWRELVPARGSGGTADHTVA